MCSHPALAAAELGIASGWVVGISALVTCTSHFKPGSAAAVGSAFPKFFIVLVPETASGASQATATVAVNIL